MKALVDDRWGTRYHIVCMTEGCIYAGGNRCIYCGDLLRCACGVIAKDDPEWWEKHNRTCKYVEQDENDYEAEIWGYINT